MMDWKRIFLSNIGIFGVQRLVLDKREKETHRLKTLVPRREILNLRVESPVSVMYHHKSHLCII